jgi:hypothetical protein
MMNSVVYSLKKSDGTWGTRNNKDELLLFNQESIAQAECQNDETIVPIRIIGIPDELLESDDISMMDLCAESSNTAKSKGFVEQTFSEFIALMHTELSEAFEEWRSGKGIDEVYASEGGKPEGILTELADVQIRLAHFLGERGLVTKFIKVIRDKLAYNKTRAFRHGKIV